MTTEHEGTDDYLEGNVVGPEQVAPSSRPAAPSGLTTDYDVFKAQHPDLLAAEERCLALEEELARLRERVETLTQAIIDYAAAKRDFDDKRLDDDSRWKTRHHRLVVEENNIIDIADASRPGERT